MVILGAGASADSVLSSLPDHTTTAWAMPVTSGLFGDRAAFNEIVRNDYPEALPAIAELRIRVAAGAELETELAKMQERATWYAPDRIQLAGIRFYLQDIIRRCSQVAGNVAFTNHLLLVRRLDRWRQETGESILYVTFNYDLLLEQALSRVLGVAFPDMASYIDDPRFALIKLHGSIDWWHPIDGDFPAQNPANQRRHIIEQIDHLSILDTFIHDKSPDPIAQDPNTTSGGGLQRLRFPALAIPVERKPHFECPVEHQDALGRLLPSVDKVLLVGWKAREKHFLDVLSGAIRDDPEHVHDSESGAARPRTRLDPDALTLAVTGTPDGMTAVRTRLGDRLGLHNWAASVADLAGGLSSLMAGDRLDELLDPSKPRMVPLGPTDGTT